MKFEVVDEVPDGAYGRGNPVYDGISELLLNSNGKPVAVDVGEGEVPKVLANVRCRLYRNGVSCKSFLFEGRLYLVLCDKRRVKCDATPQ